MRVAVRSLVVAAVSVSAVAGPAAARPPADRVAVHLHPRAAVDAAGVLTGRVRVACPAGHEVLEAHVTASQDNGQNFMGPILGVRCTGKQRWYPYRVTSFDVLLRRGSTFASAFVLSLAPDGTTTADGGDTRVVRAR